MIIFENLSNADPYKEFESYYHHASQADQQSIEACCISSYNKEKDQVNSRFVNLKYIRGEEWIFFSNYNSKKAQDFSSNNQISSIFFWDKINVQIRMNGQICKTSKEISDLHFKQRSKGKNALAISSYQSKEIASYEEVTENFERLLKDESKLAIRPDFWGGYSFTPTRFEFWEGHSSRLNKRKLFSMTENGWKLSYLQP